MSEMILLRKYLFLNKRISLNTGKEISPLICRHLADDRNVVDLSYSVYEEHSQSCHASPLLITHGLLGSRSNWHSLAKSLNNSTKRKVYTCDLRGHGDSPHHDIISCDAMSNDILQLLSNWGLSRAILMGHSLGGRVMMAVALKKPEVVERLVIVDISPVSSVLPNPAEQYLHAMNGLHWDSNLPLADVRRYADKKLSSVVKDKAVRQFLLLNLVTKAGKVSWRCDIKGLLKNYNHFFETVRSDVKYEGPTLFIGGGNSNYILKENHQEIRKYFSKAKILYIEGAGHWVHADNPHEFLSTVSQFLE